MEQYDELYDPNANPYFHDISDYELQSRINNFSAIYQVEKVQVQESENGSNYHNCCCQSQLDWQQDQPRNKNKTETEARPILQENNTQTDQRRTQLNPQQEMENEKILYSNTKNNYIRKDEMDNQSMMGNDNQMEEEQPESNSDENQNILNTQWTTQLQQYNRNQQQSYPIIGDEYIKECNDFLNQKQICRSFKSNSDFSDPNDNYMEQECEQPRLDQESINQQDDNGQINLNQSSQFQNQKILTAQSTTQRQQFHPQENQSQQNSQQPENTNQTNNSTDTQETKKKAKRGRPKGTLKNKIGIKTGRQNNNCQLILTRLKQLYQEEMKEDPTFVPKSVIQFFQNNKRLDKVPLEMFNDKLENDKEFRYYIHRAFTEKKDFFWENLGRFKNDEKRKESYYQLLRRFDFYAHEIKHRRKIPYW